MATISRFEDLEIWKLARQQVKDFNELVETSSLKNNFALRDQMDKSSGSVMDCIAEGFERGGNKEFANFLLIAKGSNGEYRSQLSRCFDRKHIDLVKLENLVSNNEILAKKIMSFVSYLLKSNIKGIRYKPAN